MGAETFVNGLGAGLPDQCRQECARVEIGTQSSFDQTKSRISTDDKPTPGRARVRARSRSWVPLAAAPGCVAGLILAAGLPGRVIMICKARSIRFGSVFLAAAAL